MRHLGRNNKCSRELVDRKRFVSMGCLDPEATLSMDHAKQRFKRCCVCADVVRQYGQHLNVSIGLLCSTYNKVFVNCKTFVCVFPLEMKECFRGFCLSVLLSHSWAPLFSTFYSNRNAVSRPILLPY